MNIDQLEPRAIWQNFARLNAVPRPSKKEARIVAFVKAFGEDLGLKTQVDRVGNVVIEKPATAGRQDRKTVVLQSHLDMVHQKNEATAFDFETQSIDMYVEGDWVKARGTTLGADNGIGVAAILSVLASDALEHPPLVALFTVDEETGMTGAAQLESHCVKWDILLNLDTEKDTELSVGCAGGVDTILTGSYREEPVPPAYQRFTLQVEGLRGGHSGMDIHRGLGNANKIMNRLLSEAQDRASACIVSIRGGGLRNAIPRESQAQVVVPEEKTQAFETALRALSTSIGLEYIHRDPDLTIRWTPAPPAEKRMVWADQKALLRALYACYNGVYKMSAVMEGLVETSSNLARVQVAEGRIQIDTLQRSASESAKADVAHTVASAFEAVGYHAAHTNAYPGWQVNLDSLILKRCQRVYEELFHEKPEVLAGHGGLECGLLLQHFPHMDAISFGPDILGAHSPDECVKISSVQKFWRFLCAVLEAIPKRD